MLIIKWKSYLGDFRLKFMWQKRKTCSGEKRCKLEMWLDEAIQLCVCTADSHQPINMTSYSPRTKDRGHDLHWTSRLVHHIWTQISTQWHPMIYIITALLGYKIPLMAQRFGYICYEVWSEAREVGKKGYSRFKPTSRSITTVLHFSSCLSSLWLK